MTAFISIEPPGRCLKTKFDFDFQDMKLMDGSLGKPCIEFFGIKDTAKDDELSIKLIIEIHQLKDVFLYDEEEGSAFIDCKCISTLDIYQGSKE